MGRVIGIDLGTTNSCVAMVDGGKPVVIPNTGGYKTTPSMFAISQDGKRLVGHLAKRQAITNARDTVAAAKRLIGRRFDSPEVQKALELCTYKIVKGERDDARIEIGDKTFTCPEIMAIIVREMKRVAEEAMKHVDGSKIELDDVKMQLPGSASASGAGGGLHTSAVFHLSSGCISWRHEPDMRPEIPQVPCRPGRLHSRSHVDMADLPRLHKTT